MPTTLTRSAALARLGLDPAVREGRLFVLGPSGVGKTTFCRALPSLAHLPASGWIREETPRPPDLSDDAYRALLTARSRARLAEDPDAALRWMRRAVRRLGSCTGGGVALDGLRNPRDFIGLFDPRRDTAVLLHRAGFAPINAFEAGLETIVAYLRWCEQCWPGRSLLLEVSLDEAPRRVHHDLLPAPLRGFVAERFLYDLDPARTAWLPAEILAVSTYPREALTLVARLLGDGPEHGGVFCYLPLDAFSTVEPAGAPLRPLSAVVYRDCPEGPCALERLAGLPEEVSARLRGTEGWEAGRYLGTLDWYEGNDLLNLVLLESGQLAALPFHRLKFGTEAPRILPPFRKLRSVWQVSAA